MRATVSVTPCASYERAQVKQALLKALEPFSEILDEIHPGTRVVIKANLVSMMKPEAAATTHPELLYALCENLIARGADVVVGDSPGGLYTSAYLSGVYAATGVKAVLETGARLNQNFERVHAKNPNGVALKEFEYTAYLDDADFIINFCKLKTHGMLGMSACVKNLFGCIPGTLKPEYHYRFPEHARFADMLVDLNERFRPRLCLVDAVSAMEGNGPTQGKPRHVGALLASNSPYACDLVCAQLIGIDPEQVETIQAASRRGLNVPCSVIGNPERFAVPDFELVRTRSDLAFGLQLPGVIGKVFGAVARKALSSRPMPNKAECIGCGKCAQLCPAKAIAMRDKRPQIAAGACIHCFCCQEFCPVGAMKVKRPIIARILSK